MSSSPVRILHLASRDLNPKFWPPAFIGRLKELGDLTIHEKTSGWSGDKTAGICRQHDVVITGWGSRPLPDELADHPGSLRWICNLNGETRPFVSRRFIEAGLLVTNWGDVPAFNVAEGALALLLASLKNLIPQHEAVRKGGWATGMRGEMGSVGGLRLGVYGLGVIGRAFIDLVTALKPELHGYDPYCKPWPRKVRRLDTLDDLFGAADAVVITAALTDETRRSVTAGHLARLPDGGVVINVGRGAIIDQEALFRELETGRLRAGLDVLDSNGRDFVEPDHPARQWPNLILSAHVIGGSNWNRSLYNTSGLLPHHEVCLDNLRLFVEGKPLRNAFDLDRYDRST